MDELIKLVSQKANIPEESARTAVETVVGFLKDRLPAPMAAQLDAVLSSPATGSVLGQAAAGLGGLLGKKG